MPLTDTQGVKWAHSDTCKAGDHLRMDGGFTCMDDGDIRVIKTDETEDEGEDGLGQLYVECEDGQHFLEGQIGDDGELVGMYPVRP